MEDIPRFLRIANGLKNVKRKGWINKVSVSENDAESVADHSYLTSLITMIIADLKGLDTCKALRMALLHDLAESVVGDYTPEEMDNKVKHKIESDAMIKILRLLPDNISEKYVKIWNEYITNNSKEADLIHQIDKFEMSLQAKKYEEMGYPYQLLKEFHETASNHIKDEQLLALLNNLKDG